MKVAKFKTCITVPARFLAEWEQNSKAMLRNIGGNLSRYRRAPAQRDRLTGYTARGSECVICNVYWEIEVYNQLHAVASRLRISVSRLLLEMLLHMLAGGKVRKVFTSYAFRYAISANQVGVFVEKMSYSNGKARQTEKIT